jgi:uncharacterized protein (TIGR03435 family)
VDKGRLFVRAPRLAGDVDLAQQRRTSALLAVDGSVAEVPVEIDLEAPLFACEGFTRRRVPSQSPETRPRPRWPRVDRIEAGNIPMAGLIELISGDVDRIIVDKTGFSAPFNLVLDFAAAPAPGSPFISSGPSIFEALNDQLGLQLLPGEAPLDVLVIESADQPVVN